MQAHFQSGFSLSTAASVQAVTARNLQLLQAIENTVSRLTSDTDLLHSICLTFAEVFDALKKADGDEVIDPQGIVCNSLRNASEATTRIYASTTRARQSARDDKRLRSDDGVVDAFDRKLKVVRSMHDLIEEMVEWIEIHDASLEKPTGAVYATVDELFDALDKE